MVNKIIQYFKRLEKKLEIIDIRLRMVDKKVQDKDINEARITVLRHCLGSVGLSDIQTIEQMTEADRRSYVGAVKEFYHSTFLPAYKKILDAQTNFAINESQMWEQVIFARGTINGLTLLNEEFMRCIGEHNENQEILKQGRDSS